MTFRSFLFFFLSSFLLTGVATGQRQSQVDILAIEATVEPLTSTKQVQGSVMVSFEVKSPMQSIYLDAIAMDIVADPSSEISIEASADKIWLKGNFQPDTRYQTTFDYTATPSQTIYFTGDQIWTQGQGKYTSHWLPSLDDVNDKIEFDLTIVAQSDRTVTANGRLVESKRKETKTYWKFDMQQPMSSYLVALAIGPYQKQTKRSASQIPIELYYLPEDSLKLEPTYRYTIEIFDFLEKTIGIAYPWQTYKQVPVRDFLYAGMENTTLTIFSEAFVVDSIGFTDRNYVNINAHEMAHQWFGNLITETDGSHHWLQEGFATYYALLAERSIFGEDYYYWKLYQSAEQLKTLSDEGKGQSLLDPKASSLTFYEKGAWALHILQEQIGEEAFQMAVKNYLMQHRFKNVTTEDFLSAVRKASSVSIEKWKEDWLEQTAFQGEQAYRSLRKSDFMDRYFEISRLAPLPLAEKKEALAIALFEPNDFIGQEVVYQLLNEPIAEVLPLYQKALGTNNVYVRQAVATTLAKIPVALEPLYVTLLQDSSYATREAALYNLWVNFPENRIDYLKATEGMIGFQNKNIRQLWLVLALVTPTYAPDRKSSYLEELQSYTSPTYSFEVREMALSFVAELKIWNERTLINLVNASLHPNWRFRNSARDVLDNLLEDSTFKNQLAQLLPALSEEEQAFLNKKIIQ